MNYDTWLSTEPDEYYGPRFVERTCFKCKERFPMPMIDREYEMHPICPDCQRSEGNT